MKTGGHTVLMQFPKGTREGLRHHYTLEPGDDYALLDNGDTLITNPARPPFLVHPDGSRTELKIAPQFRP